MLLWTKKEKTQWVDRKTAMYTLTKVKAKAVKVCSPEEQKNWQSLKLFGQLIEKNKSLSTPRFCQHEAESIIFGRNFSFKIMPGPSATAFDALWTHNAIGDSEKKKKKKEEINEALSEGTKIGLVWTVILTRNAKQLMLHWEALTEIEVTGTSDDFRFLLKVKSRCSPTKGCWLHFNCMSRHACFWLTGCNAVR